MSIRKEDDPVAVRLGELRNAFRGLGAAMWDSGLGRALLWCVERLDGLVKRFHLRDAD